MIRIPGVAFLLAFLMMTSTALSQVTVSGIVVDDDTDTPLSNVNIRGNEGPEGTVTDGKGFFSLILRSRSRELTFSNVGYKTRTIELGSVKDTSVRLGTVRLSKAVIGLNEIKILAPEIVERQTPVAAASISASQRWGLVPGVRT